MPGSRRVVVVAVAALAGGLTAGGAARVAGDAGPDAARPATRPATGPERVPRPLRAPRVARSEERSAPPTRLRIEAADVLLPVVPRGVDAEGQMALPGTPFAAAWYRYGADPTDARGAVVVAGHVDTAEQGTGPLARLAGLQVGSEVELDHRGGSTTYRVTDVRSVPKARLDLPALFRRTGPPRLHLITCGGAWLPEQGGYQDNVVVVAEQR